MQYCIFSHTEDNQPKQKEKSWNDLVNSLTKHRETTVDKNKPGRIDIPLLSFVTYYPSSVRAKRNVKTVNAAALDIDYITPSQWQEIETDLTENNISAFWYTSFNHGQAERADNYKIRLILRLSRPVTPSEWDALFSFFQARFRADGNARDASRMFFGPFIASGATGHFTGAIEGDSLDVDKLLEDIPKRTQQIDVDLPPPAPITIDKPRLTLLIRKLARRSDTNSQLAAEILTAIRDGEAFTTEGHRDKTVFQYVVSTLVREWRGIDSDQMAELATPSLEKTGGVTPAEFKYKIEREKAHRQKQYEEIERQKKIRHEKSLAKAQINRQLVGVDNYYVEDSLPCLGVEAMTSRQNFEVQIQSAKVVQHQGDYYFWCNGTYQGPIQRRSFVPAAVKYLSPFEELEVEFFDGAGNLKEIDVDDFCNRHGVFVKEVIYALGKGETSLTQDALVLPFFAPLQYEPKYSEKVDLWIRCLFGGCLRPDGDGLARVEWAKRWLCHYRDHDLLLPALLLVGVTGAGKGLFAEFLAQAYEVPAISAPLSGLYAIGTENDIYPIMVADEEFPAASSAQIRDKITAKTHYLKKKYQNIRRVQGYVRQLFLLNDADRIKTFDVGTEAQRATAERFVYVEVTTECRTYLETLCKNDEHLVPGELQRHIEWLRTQHDYTVIDKGRFAVSAPKDNKAFYETFYREKNRFALLNLICDYVCRGTYPVGYPDRYGGWPIEVLDQGTVKIKTAPFCAYCEDRLMLPKAVINRQLKSIADKIHTRKGRYWILDTDHLYRWAEIAMEYSEEEITDALNMTTESKIDSAVRDIMGVLN